MGDRSEPREKIAAAFQGGGAKAIAYAGALLALEEQGYAVGAAAGTSAGSIVATLVAAGLTAQEIRGTIPTLLGLVQKHRTDVLLSSNPDPRYLGEYSLEGVRIELERILRDRIGKTGDSSDVTFSELFTATKVELNILATVAPGAPAVFSVYASPDCQVSHAVAASCAIPIVMNPQLLQTHAAPERDSLASPDGVVAADVAGAGLDPLNFVHPLAHVANVAMDALDPTGVVRIGQALVVDGGLWANYPGLCFDDPSFRYFYGAPTLDLPTVGFSIDTNPDPSDHIRTTPLARGKQKIVRALLGLLKWLILNPALLMLATVGLLGWSTYRALFLWSVPLSEVSWGSVAARVLESVGWLLLSVLVFAVCSVGRHLRPLGIAWQTIVAGLTSTTLKVPEWVGAHPLSRLILVPASRNLIATTDFNPTIETINTLVERARARVSEELTILPLNVPHQGRRKPTGASVRFSDITDGDYQTDGALLKDLLGMSVRETPLSAALHEALRQADDFTLVRNRAGELWSDPEVVKDWMTAPNALLRGSSPVEVVRLRGADEVIAVLDPLGSGGVA